MTSASWIGLAFVGVAMIQSLIGVWFDRSPLISDAFRKIVEDDTKRQTIDGIATFFADKDAGPARLDQVSQSGSLASRVTTQLTGLTESVIGLIVIAVFAFVDSRGIKWEASSVVVTVLALAFLIMLIKRIVKGQLRDFRVMRRPPNVGVFDTPLPYLVLVVVAAIFGSAAGVALA